MNTYSENLKTFNEDKNKALFITCMQGYIRTMFKNFSSEYVTDDMKITISIDSKYYEFNYTESIQGEEYEKVSEVIKNDTRRIQYASGRK